MEQVINLIMLALFVNYIPSIYPISTAISPIILYWFISTPKVIFMSLLLFTFKPIHDNSIPKE